MEKKAYILRRRKLGRTSCKNIRMQSKYIMKGRINDQKPMSLPVPAGMMAKGI